LDRTIPASVNSALDALLDDADAATNSTADEELESDAPVDEGDELDEESESPDDDVPADDDDAHAEGGDDEEEEDDPWAGVPAGFRAAFEQQQQTIQSLMQRQQQEEQERQQAQLNARYDQWVASLQDMDPEDRNAEIVKVLSDGASALIRREQTRTQNEQAQRTFQVQHTASLNFVAAGSRVEPTGNLLPDGRREYRRVDKASLPLTEAEKRIVAKVKGGPLEMQEAADELVAMRRGQTAKARAALANKRREENEGPSLTPGRRAAGNPPEKPDYSSARTLNDRLDMMLDYEEAHNAFPALRK
jgi:hypothetical protein